jgi:hypothetical protein
MLHDCNSESLDKVVVKGFIPFSLVIVYFACSKMS